MPLHCPACKREISISGIRSVFACPACCASLKSNFGRVVCNAVLGGIFIEAALIYIFYIAAGSLASALQPWLIIAGIPAYMIYWIATRHFLEIQHAS
jgi:hypothetical protein